VVDARLALLGGVVFALLVAGITRVFLPLSRFQLEGGLFLRGGTPARPQTLYLEAGLGRRLPLLGPHERLRFRGSQTFRASVPLALVALREDPGSGR